jgi:hypothetical protein
LYPSGHKVSATLEKVGMPDIDLVACCEVVRGLCLVEQSSIWLFFTYLVVITLSYQQVHKR